MYLSTVIFAWCFATLSSPDIAQGNLVSPWIGQSNATKLIGQRLQSIEDRYKKVLIRTDWKMLRMSSNVTLETLPSEDGSWPLYIRTTAVFQASPQEIIKQLGWLQFDETQKKVDTFHESAQLLFPPSHKSKVVRKV